MATIEKRGNTYRISVSNGYDVRGKQIRQTKTWKPDSKMTEKQIEKELNKQIVIFEEACKNGKITANIKFEDFANQWFREYAEIKLKAQTIRGHHYREERTYKAIGHLRIDKITTRNIQKFISELTEVKRNDNIGKKGKTLSPKTIRHYLSFISSVFDYAIKMQMLNNNPCKNVILPSLEQNERNIYTIEEAQELINILLKEDEKNFKFSLFYIVAIFTGFRRGEILGLEWRDINYLNNSITVNRTSNWTKERGIYTDTPKTRSSRRCLILDEKVVELLKKFQAIQQKQLEELGDLWINTNRIFTQWNGLPMSTNAPNAFLKRFCKRWSIKYLNIHSFRHLNATIMALNGNDIKTVQTCLGHSSPTTTMNLYLHSFQTSQIKAIESVAKSFNLIQSK